MNNHEQICINLFTFGPNFESYLSIVSRNTASQEGHLKEGTCVGDGRGLWKAYHFIRILNKRLPVMTWPLSDFFPLQMKIRCRLVDQSSKDTMVGNGERGEERRRMQMKCRPIEEGEGRDSFAFSERPSSLFSHSCSLFSLSSPFPTLSFSLTDCRTETPPPSPN